MKKILLLFSFIFSFSAYSAVYKVDRFSGDSELLSECYNVNVGSIFDYDKLPGCIGLKYESGYNTCTVTESNLLSDESGVQLVSYCSSGKNWYDYMYISSASCESPDVIDPDTGKCGPPKCKAGDIVGPKSWPWSSSGNNPSLCLQQCKYNTYESIACLISTDTCVGKFISTESACSDNGLSSGGSFPTPPPGGCIWTGPPEDRVLECSGDADGDGNPDPDAPVDPDSECSWDGDTLTCTGGTYPPTTNPDPDGGGSGGDDGVNPVPPSSDLSGVIEAVRDFNKDNNANLKRLNDTNKEGFDSVVETNTQGFSDVINANNEGFVSVVGAINGKTVDLSKIEGSLTSIQTGIGAIVNTDISGANFTDCYSLNNCTSLYESEYSEYANLSDMVSEKINEISSGAIKDLTDSFVTVDVSNAQKPDTTACFDFGFVNFGCFDFFEDLSWIWSFIRVCFIFTAIMTARKLVFGG